MAVEVDHLVIHVDDWDTCRAFYRDVLGFQEVPNPEGASNPLGAWAFRVAGQQINVHGPWPGQTGACCPAPFNTVGATDLAFRTERSSVENEELLRANGVDVVAGPVRRFGYHGWGTSIYCFDPSGNGVELISYAEDA